jgi:hypothetical protein
MKNGSPVLRASRALVRSQRTPSPAMNASLWKPLSGALLVSPPALNTSKP